MTFLLGIAAMAANAEGRAEGHVSAGRMWAGDVEVSAVFSDVTFAYDWELVTAELGMFGVVGRLHETYANITVRTDEINFAIGFPRPAYDGFAASELTAMMPRYALETVGQDRSKATFGTMNLSDFLPYGAVAEGRVGWLEFAVSLHEVPDWNVTIAGAGGAIAFGNIDVSMAIEAVKVGGVTAWNSKAQVVARAERGSYGAGVYNSSANAQPDMIEVFGRRTITDAMDVTVVGRMSSVGTPVIAAALHYAFSEEWSLAGGLAGAGQDRTAEVGLHYSF
jgi:hypothetical protein